MSNGTTGPVNGSAFRIARTVSWGDCDPAGIIYTPRVLDYAMETLEAWNREVLEIPWIKLNREMSLGMPTVRAELDFMGAPAPDEEVVTELRVESVGRSSITFRITGEGRDGRDLFRVKVTSCVISRPAFKSTPIPEAILQRIHDYREGLRGAIAIAPLHKGHERKRPWIRNTSAR